MSSCSVRNRPREKSDGALSVISYLLLVSVHPKTVFFGVILRSKATKNLIVVESAEILRFAQNDMKSKTPE